MKPAQSAETKTTQAPPTALIGGEDSWLTPARFAGVLAIFICAAYPDVVFGRNTFFFRDFGYFGYPLAHYVRESFWRGEVPLWNPLSNCGLPFLAQWNTLALYPGSLIYILLPAHWSLAFFCLGHLLLGGLGMYGLAHRWTGDRLGASVAGMAYAFNGLLLNSLMWPNNIAAFGWMPFVVWFVERAWSQGGRWLAVAAVVGATQMLAGAPEVILFTWGIAAAFGLAEFIRGGVPRLALVRRVLLVGLLVAGLAAAQLLPFLDLLRHSQRGLNFADSAWAMPEAGWANFLVPAFRTYLNRQGVIFQYGQYWTSSYYLGIGIVALALVACGCVRNRRVGLLAGLTLLSLVLALGNEGYLYPAIRYWLPQLGFMRFPIKFVILTIFCGPLLAGYAVAYFRRAPAESLWPIWRRVFILWLALLAGVGIIVWFSYRFPLDEENWKFTAQNGASRAAFLTLVLGSVYALRRLARPQSVRLAQLGLLLLVGLDVLTHTPRQNPTIPRAALEPGLVKLDPQPRHGEHRAMLTPAADRKLRYTFTSSSLNDYLCSRLGLFSNCNLLEGVPKVNGFYSLYLHEADTVRRVIYESTNATTPALLDFLSVVQITAPGKYFDWEKRASYIPMVSAGQRPVFLEDGQTLTALTRPDWDPREVVLLPPSAQSSVDGTNRADVRIARIHFERHSAEIDTVSDQPSLVVISQAYYHRWNALVNGRPAPLLRANHGFQAVPIPAGSSTIRLEYRDPAFRWGVTITAACLLVCGGIGFWPCRRADVPDRSDPGRSQGIERE